MSLRKPLNVVLCWHMHQPQYRNLRTGDYALSWTYLHAIKDYVDMAAHLEQIAGARAVVNFAPILLEQMVDYGRQIDAFFDENKPMSDSLLSALAAETMPTGDAQRHRLLESGLKANEQHLIGRFPQYKVLADLAKVFVGNEHTLPYLSDQLLADLLVWHHIAWLGETVRRSDERVVKLIHKALNFTVADRHQLLQVIREILCSVLNRYKALAEHGVAELSTTPYAHPIVPLLLDITSAREAMPNCSLPENTVYPDGYARSRVHMERGMALFEEVFGFKPVGCWPSEGSVSTDTLKLLDEYGFRWAASGGSVLSNSIHESFSVKPSVEPEESRSSERKTNLEPHRAWRVAGTRLASFFRDDGLSDLIGFEYTKWHAEDAVANLIHHLKNIQQHVSDLDDPVVSIILDGENAWEHYPFNGYYFLSQLYTQLAEHPDIELTTYSEFLDRKPVVSELPKLVAGSWVYGTFSTWIGDPDKNRGWDLLVEAKRAFDEVMASTELTEAERQLADEQMLICEGSDWFWWFGGYNPAESVSDFEKLYRTHLRNLYRFLKRPPPASLDQVISEGLGNPEQGGVMRHGQA